jgi:FAD/FMN-containing dehydrogenase
LPKTILPPGVSAASFASAIQEFEAGIGKEWVYTTEADLDLYRDEYSFFWDTPEEHLASAALAPASVEEVQKIVRIANKYKTPLYPISTGRNLTYGGSAPVMRGSIVLDLKRMNRVLVVDDKRHFALVEPGVSYFDLYRYIQDRGLKVWIDTADPGWGSPVGNALDRGVGWTTGQYRDHFGAHCGMEVVLPNGELMRTGMGAIPNADTWQDFRYGQGAWVDGLFSQSNFGIVTKMGFWLYPEPEAQLTGRVYFPRFDDLQALIEHMDYLENSGLIGVPSFDSPLGTANVGLPSNGLPRTANSDLAALMADGWPSHEQILAYHEKRGGPAWRLTLRFYGSEETVRAGWAYAKRRIGTAVAGVTFEDGKFYHLPLKPEERTVEHLTYFGIPNLQVFRIVEPSYNDEEPLDGHVDFWATVPRTAEGLHGGQRVIYETQREQGFKTNFNPFSSPLMFYPRTFNIGYSLPSFRNNPGKNRKALALYNALVRNCGAAGYGQYRSNIYTQDLAVAQYSYNNHALLHFQEALKEAADPNGIVAPGRYGLWPKRLRAARASAAMAKGKKA